MSEQSVHEIYMHSALDEAEKAYALGEIPCGAVIVFKGEIIARAHNTNRIENNPTRHAELTAIELAAAHLTNERIGGCSLYVTKEPCVMCAGAIIHSRIDAVYIGARDEKYGACGTRFDILGNSGFNHCPEIFFGICEQETADIIKRFFAELRARKKGRP